MSLLSTLVDSLLPNRAWKHRIQSVRERHTRLVYWVLRLGLTILGIFLIWLFGIQQHPQLR